MIVGVDYASVDGNSDPDWGGFKAACARAGSSAGFAILRGGWGTDPDQTLNRDWKGAQAAGLTTGAYLFLRMRADQPPEDQVDAFARHVGPLTQNDLPPAIDVEDTGLAPGPELDYVHRAWTTMVAIYGVPPMIYTSDRVWREDLRNAVAGEMTDSPLWVAKPWPWAVRTPAVLGGQAFAGGGLEPLVPEPWGWENWWMHQYQGDATPAAGFTHTVDLSRFHVMRQGESGVRVAWVQRRLGLPVTRTFDAQMATWLRQWQAAHGLEADAVIGPKTFAPIAWSVPSAAQAA